MNSKKLYWKNEGGRGLIVNIAIFPVFVYVCYWTKIIAPRFVLTGGKIKFSLNP